MSSPLLSIIVLTRDEALNLPHFLRSIEPLAPEIWIVDSGSTDATASIAKAAGCQIVTHPWTNYASQLNWALDTLPLTTPWVMRMDADERLTPELVSELQRTLPALGEDVSGLLVKRQVWFWGRWIRHGGYYPTWLLRIWRCGIARCEQRAMDEHMILATGRTECLRHDIIDENHKGIGFWVDKHNRYADREVADLLALADANTAEHLTDQARRRRWFKENIYLNAPLFVRPFAYWIYRYVFLLGFLDMLPGLIFHFFQGFWYRLLVDVKLYEQRSRS